MYFEGCELGGLDEAIRIGHCPEWYIMHFNSTWECLHPFDMLLSLGRDRLTDIYMHSFYGRFGLLGLCWSDLLDCMEIEHHVNPCHLFNLFL